MKSINQTQKQLEIENKNLRALLDEAEETLRAIRTGEWDALVISSVDGEQIFTLKQSELRYRRLFEAAQDGILLLDAITGAITDVNPFLMKMLGYSREEFIQKKLWEVGAFKDVKASREAFEALQQNEYIRYENLPLKTKDGRLVQVEFVSNVYIVDDEKVIQCNVRDITERKHTEEALRESEQHYRQIIETAGEGIWSIDAENRTTLANKRLAEMFGYSVQEIFDKSIFDFTDEEYQASARAGLELRKQGISTQVDFKFRRKDGGTLWTLIETSSLYGPAGNYTGMLAMLTDITGRKQIEMEMHQRLNELEVLYQSGLAFSQLIDSKTIAEKIIDLLDQKMDWHHTAIRLYHPENETLELIAFNIPNLNTRIEHSAAEERLKIMRRPDQGLTGWTIRHGRAVRCNDLKNDMRYIEIFPGLQSGLYAPIKIAERVIGVISIESQYMDAFSESDERLIVTLTAQAAIAMDNAHLFNSLKRSNSDLTSAYDATIEGWSRALDLRDKETEGHSRRVTEMTLKLARAFGLNNEDLAQVRWGSLLHDIGKMGIPDVILLKPGPLTDEEWLTMKKHPIFAYEMLLPIRYLRLALDIPYCHHEKWDGSGYPRGLKDNLIPLSARIFAVVDVFDALSSDRPYRSAWPQEKIREYIYSLSGTHFDPTVVDIFLQFLNE